MSDAEENPEGEGGQKKGKEKKKKEEKPAKEEKKEESDTDSFSRSLIDYIMPVKEMLRKMTDRRKYVIISDSADPDYLDDVEETFVRKADILWEEMYHFNLEGNLQRGRITRYLQNSTKHLEFPYIFVSGEYFGSLEKFSQLAEKNALHSKVHGFGRGLDVQHGQLSFAVASASKYWKEGISGLKRSAEKRGIIEIDTRSEKEKQKERRKKRAEKLQIQKQKDREAKKRSIKRKLEFKAKKKAAIVFLASKGINIPQEDKKTKLRKRKKKKAAKTAKANEAKESEKAKQDGGGETANKDGVGDEGGEKGGENGGEKEEKAAQDG